MIDQQCAIVLQSKFNDLIQPCQPYIDVQPRTLLCYNTMSFWSYVPQTSMSYTISRLSQLRDHTIGLFF